MTLELKALSEQFTRELHEFDLDSESEIYGRDREISELLTLVTEQCTDVYCKCRTFYSHFNLFY